MLTRQVLALAVLVAAAAAAGCASSGNVPRPRPFPGAPVAPQPDRPAAPPQPTTPAPVARTTLDRQGLVTTALALRGVPYRNGGADMSGFDCSGFTQYVFAKFGVPLPRGVREQFESGGNVKSDDIEPGDLLFFETIAKGASHVAIAIGGERFVHAPSSKGVVRVESLTTPYWSRRFVGIRRIGG